MGKPRKPTPGKYWSTPASLRAETVSAIANQVNAIGRMDIFIHNSAVHIDPRRVATAVSEVVFQVTLLDPLGWITEARLP